MDTNLTVEDTRSATPASLLWRFFQRASGVPRAFLAAILAICSCFFSTRAEVERPSGAQEYGIYRKLRIVDPESAQAALALSFEKGYRLALREVAIHGWPMDCDYSSYGSTPASARVALLDRISKGDGQLLWALGVELSSGDLEVRDYKKARVKFGEASRENYTLAWRDYAFSCLDERGGEPDFREAYYYLSAVSMVVHPESASGLEIARKREEVVGNLGKKDAIHILAKLDKAFEAGFPPLLNQGESTPSEKLESVRAKMKGLELKHREALRSRQK